MKEIKYRRGFHFLIRRNQLKYVICLIFRYVNKHEQTGSYIF